MIHTFSRTMPASDDPTRVVDGLRSMLLGEAKLSAAIPGPVLNMAWDESVDDERGMVTVTLTVDDDHQS